MVSIIVKGSSPGLLIFISVLFCLTFVSESKAAVRPVYECQLFNDTFICTGAQYRMHCNTSTHDFYYSRYYHRCSNYNDCDCRGNGNTCRCYGASTSSSCFCQNYDNNSIITAAVSPVYKCGLYNDMYICTGAQYRMYCSANLSDVYYTRDYQFCWNSDSWCYGDKYTCECSGATSSSCSCDNYSNNITITAAVRPAYECQLFNDMFICTGAQYHMHCNTSTHYFHDERFYHRCSNYGCDCRGNGNTCRCYGASTSSSCFCQNYDNNSIITAAVSPVYKCGLYNDMYICTGAQYRMYCSANASDIYYTRDFQFCWNSGSWCYGDKYTCSCYGPTSSSCSCDNYSNNITIRAAVRPAYECQLFNDMFICTGAQYRMHCNTSTHHFHDARFYHQCSNYNGCDCRGNGNTCRCYGASTSSSCFCQNYDNNSIITAAVSSVYKCGLYNDMYICNGAQYRMYCSANSSDFSFTKYQQYCWNSDSWCYGDKYTCRCYGPTSSSCSCDNYRSNITITAAVRPVYECQLFNDMFICTGAQYRMHCNTSTHSFYYSRYYHRCRNYNGCDCRGNGNTCRCYGASTSSSCFCQNYDNNSIITAAVSPVYKCGLYNDMYICTGDQYRMYCSANASDVYYTRDYQYCWNSDCWCYGDKYTCECSGATSSSCSCDNYSNNITITAAVRPVYECQLFNDMFICTGAQYRMHCNTSTHSFHDERFYHQCSNYNGCDCRGNGNTCRCYGANTSSSCFCQNYDNNSIITAAVSPVYKCGLYNDMYICTGAQYRMYCSANASDIYYTTDYQFCWNSGSWCDGDKYTCSCYGPTSPSCSCDNYSNNITITAAVRPAYECQLFNDMFICTSAQYRMHCNTSTHYFHDAQYYHQCSNYNGCDCRGNGNTCRCYGANTSSSCFCQNYDNNSIITAAVSPVYKCGLYNDMYICTGDQYRMYCSANAPYFSYTKDYQFCWNSDSWCYGDKYTCECISPTSMCFCTTDNNEATEYPSLLTAGINMTLLEECRSQVSGICVETILGHIENITELPLNDVKTLLDLVLKASENTFISSSTDPNKLVSVGNSVLKNCENLVSMLVKPTETSYNVSFTLDNLEVQVFVVGPNVILNQIPQLDTTNSSVDIDLIGIAKNNHKTKSAAVAFMSYTTMEKLLRPDFFNTPDGTVKTMMSTVISATLPKTDNTYLTKPVNFTLKHIRESDPNGSLFCVYWNIREWIVDGCSVVKTNSSHTVCSCDHLSTFALMQTSSPPEDDALMEILNLVVVIVGLVFLSLALLTFAFCRWSPGVNNVARINICLSLLLAHLLFLITQQSLKYIRPNQVLCALISWILHFLFLSSFMWMLIEAMLLFICVKSLSQISKQREVLSSGFMIVIGYVTALVVVVVSVGLVPEGYVSEKCWIKREKGFIWSFLGPVCVILILNMILFINIIVCLNSTQKNLNAEVSQMKQIKIMVFKTLAQFVVLGCPWILGFFTNSSKALEILFLILNSQQGTFIFLIHCVLNNEIRQQYLQWLSTILPGIKPQTIQYNEYTNS
ncbi:uncharacterized protein LOC127643780 isoform X2 [Xyrauchen texanus]|uniref:uncharacterized protein LOC127643780 isoform X2 n=1 Tax=Xyrauchen texanus TaxID=154827 RepID=UPI002241C897|nr:uncharacterized protein LOC127643780 isoform X2 [Xyrauchen texanus]